MPKTAFLFPGQGSQTVGMGKDICENSPAARDVMMEVADALGDELPKLMHEGPDSSLKMTRNAQPALMTSALCVVKALEERSGKKLSDLGVYVAGHSLGEYAALAAVGSLSIKTTSELLRLRGEAMQAAVPPDAGAMAALLGASIEQAEAILEAKTWEALDIANDNAPGQVVLSGAVGDIDEAIAIAKEMGIRKGVKLPVSAPFHCRLMAPAAKAMETALSEIDLVQPSLPVYCNVTAREESNPLKLKENLVSQVVGMVRWRETLLNMADAGIERFVELGTGKVLTGLVKRTLPEAKALNVETSADLDNFLEQI